MTIEQPKISANLQQGLSLDEQIKNGWKRYSEGDREYSFGVAFDLIQSYDQDPNVTDKIRELHALAAWSCYHLHKYQECLEHCGHSQSHPRALECELTLRSFISDYREEERLQELREAIGDTPAAANAFLIRAISMKDVPLAAAYYHLSKTSPDLSSKGKWLSQSVRSWKLFNEGKAPQSPSVEKQRQAEKELQELAPSLVEL